MKRQTIIWLCCLLTLFSCNQNRHVVTTGFYYSKTRFALSDYAQERLAAVDNQSLYVRFFDVDWDEASGEPVPNSITRFPQKPEQTEIVPVVFITNRTLQHLADTQVAAITAANISRLLAHQCRAAQLPAEKITEVQIDCDWKEETKAVYFSLLRTLRKQDFFKGKKLCVTIRLPQIKFSNRIGVPPVDKGLLLAYNADDAEKADSSNAILDPEKTKKYLDRLEKYPLTLDVGLPLFSWCLLYEQGQFKGIMRDVHPDDLKEDPLFVQQGNNTYRCTADTVWHDYILKRHAIIRTERTGLKDILEIARFTSERIANDSLHVVLYHADSVTLSKFSNEELQKIFAVYR